ncbi:MAG: gamma-glutamyl-gamma-aminobutyrate hydrolase family protein [Lacisediminihabitans sp.]
MNQQYRPRIAVIGRLAKTTSALRYRAVVNARALLEAVWNAGGDPFTLLPVKSVNWGERLGGFDGLLLPGGGDIDPARYTRDARADSIYDVDTLQDTADIESAGYALDSGMAVLAICRGLHVVNVARGGTLVQNLPNAHRDLVHEVAIQRDFERFGFTESTVRASCYHHQALDRLGQGISVVARSEDGVAEAATIDAAGWAVGVQWHPEDTADEDPQQAALFSEFVRQAKMARQSV